MTRKNGSGPSESERKLFQLWDAIDKARERSGESEAQRLATKALKAAVEPPEQEKDKQP
jgi:hypothetical protein